MEKKGRVVILCFIFVMLLAAQGAFGWFNDTLRDDAQIESYVHKSYFESGDGTAPRQYQTYDANGDPVIYVDPETGEALTSEEGCAFEIKYPIQLYYFAWLQYLGYFNQPNEDGSTINQVYFYLSDDLDMTGWTLPPIGTEQYPFVGNFNGNGHVISNLTVQNVTTGTDSNPTTLNDMPVNSVTGVNIVGFFGIVGSLNASGTVQGAVEQNGQLVPSGSESYTYATATNEIINFALSDITIKTEQSPSLAGLVAGYANGRIANVRVGQGGTIVRTGAAAATAFTNNLSDYTLIGYVTDTYKDTSDVVRVKVDTPQELKSHFNYVDQGQSAGWGGSIDMLDMYTRLGNVHGTNFGNMTRITQANHIATEVRRYNAAGELIGAPAQTPGAPEDNFYYQYTPANDGSGNYVLSAQNGTGTTAYYYLAGTYKDVIEIHETNDTEAAFYIQHNGVYLNLNDAHTGLTNATPTGGNTKWMTDADNCIYTQDNDGNIYYLYDNNGTLAIRTLTYYYISYTANGTTYYLNENNGAIQRGTTATTKWFRSGDNTGTLYTQSSNGNTYYLYTANNTNGSLSLSTTNQTTWTFNSDGTISYNYNGGWNNYTYYVCIQTNGTTWTCRRDQIGNYGTIAKGGLTSTAWNISSDAIRNSAGAYIQYDNGWKLRVDAPATTGYTIRSGNNYLNATGTNSFGTGNSVADTTDNNHTLWTFSNPGTNPSGTISTTINGGTYYLRISSNTLSISTTSSSWTNTNGQLYSGNRYLRYNNGWTTSRNTATTLTITQVTIPAVTHTALTFTNTTIPVVNRIEKSEPAEYSYIPLAAPNTSPYGVIYTNTGYIVGGSHETTSDRKSDIRVSQYAKSNISSGLTNTNNNGQIDNSSVRTVDGTGIHTLNNINSLARYAAASSQLNQVLNGTTNVYGLHFMNAEISTNNLITAPTVLLEGSTITNYQMPEDSIDFNVHQKGYITFFAGTYFTNNNSFFSLHVIERSDDKKTITSIKEIKEIYKSTDKTKEYIYYLKNEDGTYEWSDTLTSDYSLAFNTDWITQPGTTNQLGTTNLYYFEIPVNKGEYALGSVEGRIGAYLIYLDIAANAQLVDRATFIENIEEITKTYEYPVGATFQNTDIPTSNTSDVIPSALAAVARTAAEQDVTVTDDTHISFNTGTVNYIKDGVTVNNSLTAANIPGNPVSTTTTKIRRTTYKDYNVAKDIYTVTVAEVRQVDSGTPTLTINAWTTDSDWDIEGANVTQIANMTTGIAFNTGADTTGVQISPGVTETLDYDVVDEVYCYLIKVGDADGDLTLRLDLNALEGGLAINDLLYEFYYCIKDNDDATNGATIDYQFDCDIAFDQDSYTDEGLFTFSNREYDITVTTTESITTRVITAVTDNNYTVTLTPTPTS